MAEQSLSQQTASRSALLDQKAQAENAMSLMFGEPLTMSLDVSTDILNRPLVKVAPSIPAQNRPLIKATVETAQTSHDLSVTAFRQAFCQSLQQVDIATSHAPLS